MTFNESQLSGGKKNGESPSGKSFSHDIAMLPWSKNHLRYFRVRFLSRKLIQSHFKGKLEQINFMTYCHISAHIYVLLYACRFIFVNLSFIKATLLKRFAVVLRSSAELFYYYYAHATIPPGYKRHR